MHPKWGAGSPDRENGLGAFQGLLVALVLMILLVLVISALGLVAWQVTR